MKTLPLFALFFSIFTLAFIVTTHSCKKKPCEHAEIIGNWSCINCEVPHSLTVKTDILTNCDGGDCVDWNYIVNDGTLFFASNVWDIETLDCKTLLVNSKGTAIEFQRD